MTSLTGHNEGLSRANAGIAMVVGVGALLSPRALLGVFGVRPREVTGAGAFGWRLFGTRNIVLATSALRGHGAARDIFLPVQVLDQLVFRHAYRTGAVPKGGAIFAIGISGLIIVLDLLRRAAPQPASPRVAGEPE